MKNSTESHIKFGRTINRETPIGKDTGIMLISPHTEEGMAAAEKLKSALSTQGVKAEIISDPEPDFLKKSNLPVIVIGNLADSKCCKYLYYKLLSLVDCWYPGVGGYTIRTLLNPFGTGFNIIHIGYSDATGLSGALKCFVSKISNPLPYFNEVAYTRIPCFMKYAEKIKASAVAESDELIPSINASFWWYVGYIAYLTNDSEQLEKYLGGWRKVVEISKRDPAIIGSAHLHMLTHIEMWRLMEASGMIPDDLRGDIEGCIYNWAQSDEGMKYVAAGCSQYLPSHNHSMFCALSLTYAADFFSTHYPELSVTDEWIQAAEDVFYTFNNGGWKPLCDDSAYSNQTSLPIICMYSIFEDKHRFLENSGRQAAEWIKAVIGQNGFIPSFGDGTVYNPFPGTLLAVLSHYYNDGELKYIHDKVPHERSFLPEICLHGAFDSGVEPVKPADAFMISILPLDRYIYDCWDKDERLARGLTFTPPYGPYQQCFDKVSIRSGWEENDDFLLIDGLGTNGNHAFSDAMGVLDYSSAGITWLVEENCYRWPEPENCCILTIARNGYACSIPGIALMEENRRLNDRAVYLRMRLKNYNGTDWIREVIFIKGLCVVFRDTVEALENGDYVVCSHFKTPGKAWLEGNTLKSLRENSKGDKYELRLSGYGSSDITMITDEIPVGEILFTCGGVNQTDFYNHQMKMAELGKEMWPERYHESSMVVTAETTRASASLTKGETISLTHVVHPAAADAADIIIEEDDGILRLLHDKDVYEFPVAAFIPAEKTVLDSTPLPKQMPVQTREIFDADITRLFSVTDTQYACALAGGSLVLFRSGVIRWRKELHAEIHCLAYIKDNGGMLLIGSGNDMLLAMDMEGNLLWNTSISRIATVFASWEKPFPQVLAVKCAAMGKNTVIIAGCGDDHIRIFDLSGCLLNAIYTYATVPDTLELVDIDGDGELEILAVGKENSHQGVFYVYDIDGKPGDHIYTGVWLCNVRSYFLSSMNGKFTLACGMKFGENFKILEIENGRQKSVAVKMLGGAVNTICSNGNGLSIYAGTSKGFIISLTDCGENRWYLDVNKPVLQLFCTADDLLALCGRQIISVSDEGKIKGVADLPTLPACWLQTENGILAGCGKCLCTYSSINQFRAHIS